MEISISILASANCCISACYFEGILVRAEKATVSGSSAGEALGPTHKGMDHEFHTRP